MALIQDTYLTDKGFEIANKAANGQTSFEITKVVSSDQNINSKTKDEIKKLNNLSDEINSGQIINTDIKSNNLTGIVTQFGNDIYTSGYEVGAIALYAKEKNSDNEFLYSVTPMVENQKIPEVNTNVFLGFQVTIYVVAGDSQRMNVNLSKGGDASIDLVEKLVSNAESDFQKKLDNKADKSDLSNLQTSVNNDIQPKLDNKANNSDLSNLQTNINSDIQPKLNNKYDKSEVDSKLNSAQNEAVNQAGQYTDQVKNNLQDKNNILSSRLEDYQKPNLLELNISNIGLTQQETILGTAFLEAGKTYKVTIDNKIGGVGDYNDVNYDFSFGQNRIQFINTAWNGKEEYKQDFVSSQTGTHQLIAKYSGAIGGLLFKQAWITQTSDFIPYEIAQQNKASIESENVLTDDYQAPNLAPITEYEYNAWNAGGYGSKAPFSINVEQGKKYWFSLYVDKNDSNFASTSNGIGKVQGASAINPDVNTGKWHVSEGNYYICNWIADRTDSIDISFATYNLTDTKVSKICITQSDEYVPFEVAQRNKLWNDRITNKTNDLSSKVDENSRKDNARMDYLGATKYDKSETYNKGEIDNKTDNLSSKIDSNYNDINNKITNSVNTSIQQANQTTQQLSKKVDDNTARINAMKIHNLAPGTSIAWYGWSGNWQLDGSSIYVEEGKTYWFSCYVDNGPANISSATLNRSGQWFAIAPDVNTGQNTVNSGNYFITKWVADRTGNFYISANTSSSGLRQISKLCITQSDNYIPFEQTDSNPDNNKVATLNYVNDQLARLSKNSWRELKLEKFMPNTFNPMSLSSFDHVFCKVNFSTNRATIYGNVSYDSSNAGMMRIIIRSSNDFKFASSTEFKAVNISGFYYGLSNNNGDLEYNDTASIYGMQISATVPIKPK